MIARVAASELPRELLLLADPDWSAVQSYLKTADCYAERQAGKIIGSVVVTQNEDQSYEVKNLAVSPNYQQRGIAKRLLQFVIHQCRQNPACETLWVGTGNSSLRQLALYQRAGFEMQTVWVNYFVDNYAEPIYENGIRCKSMVRLCITTREA